MKSLGKMTAIKLFPPTCQIFLGSRNVHMCRDSSFIIRPLVNVIFIVYMYMGMFSVFSVIIVS